MPAPYPQIASRGKIASRVKSEQLFALKVPKHKWVLIPVYEFAKNALSSGAIIGITSVINHAPWFELGFVRHGEFNSELRETVYSVFLISRNSSLSNPKSQEIKINASRIGCIFNNDKSRLPVATG